MSSHPRKIDRACLGTLSDTVDQYVCRLNLLTCVKYFLKYKTCKKKKSRYNSCRILTCDSQFYVHDHGSWDAIRHMYVTLGQVVDLTQKPEGLVPQTHFVLIYRPRRHERLGEHCRNQKANLGPAAWQRSALTTELPVCHGV